VDKPPHGVHTGGVPAVFNFVNVGVVVTCVHGEFFLADLLLEAMFFEVLPILKAKISFSLRRLLSVWKSFGFIV